MVDGAGQELLRGWQGGAGVGLSWIWSDNLTLGSEGGESGNVGVLSPYVSLRRDGARFRIRFNYSPNLVVYPEDSERTSLRHVLSANADAELIERYLFLDVTAKANQALINPRSRAGFDSIANEDAFTQTASLTVTPRIVFPAVGGDLARVEISPGIGAVFAASTVDGGETTRPTRDTRASVISGPRFANLPWRVTWQRRIWDADTDQGMGSVSAWLGYIFSPRYRATAILGYDDGDFVARNNRSRGARWELLFDWTPKPTSSFRVGVGQAFYGDFASLAARHRHKRWAFRTDYRVSIETAATSIAEQEIVPLTDLFGNPIVDPITGDVVEATVTTPALIDDSFLRQRWSTSVAYSWGRNNAVGSWIITERDYSTADLDTIDNQWRFSYSRRLSGRLSATTQVIYWDHSESRSEEFDYQQDSLSFSLRYRLGSRTNLAARYSRQQRGGQDRLDDFTENRIALNLSFRLR